ncbi:MAG: S1 family peptidase [Bacteroidetes bacterium]|nr:S1 family peptidase [Bacteroidota bacterium]
MLKHFGILIGLGLILATSSSDIVRRHDKADKEYLELGKRFPAVGKVGLRGGDGTLIRPDWVLTAAHVAQGMYERQGENLKVYFGGSEVGYRVTGVYIHPDFAPMEGSDIALLKLEKSVDGTTPMAINSKSNELNQEIFIVGHGDAKAGNESDWITDGQKRAATNLIDEVNEDKIIFDFDEPDNGTELEGTAGPGDSGGPAIITSNGQQMVVGISSAGMPGKRGPGSYGAKEFYTRVSSYASWIEDVIKNPSKTKALSAAQKAPQNKAETGRPSGGGQIV